MRTTLKSWIFGIIYIYVLIPMSNCIPFSCFFYNVITIITQHPLGCGWNYSWGIGIDLRWPTMCRYSARCYRGYIHKKYMSCLPLRRQLLKILDIKGSFLIAILRYLFKVFKVPRATILGQYCFKSRWSFPYPHLQLGSEIWIYDPFYKISTSLILYLNIFFLWCSWILH